MPSTISSSVTAAMAPPLRRTTSRAYQPSAGLPIASDLAIVAGLTGRMWSLPSAKAVATGEQPCGLGAGDADAVAGLDETELGELAEALVDLGQLASRGDRDDDVVGQLPAELLGDLEGEGLGALGVVGADVDVDEGPGGELARQLGAEPVDVVVAAVDGDEVAAEDGRRDELHGLEVVGHEDERLHAGPRRVGGDGVGEVAGRGAGGDLEAELAGLGRARRRRRGL